MLRMEDKQEGRTWIVDDDIESDSPEATKPPNFFFLQDNFPYRMYKLP